MAAPPQPVYGPLPASTRADGVADCSAALMLLDMDLQGVFACTEGVMLDHFPSASAKLRLSLMLLLMEASRQSKLDFYLETVYDDYKKEHLPIQDEGYRVHAKSLRLWIPVPTIDMLTIFYEKIELLIKPDEEEVKTAKRLSRSDEDEPSDEAGCRFISSEAMLLRAVLVTFHGRSDYHYREINKSAPVTIGEHEPSSLAAIFDAETLFGDPVYQRRLRCPETRGYHAPLFQCHLGSYVVNGSQFRCPPQLDGYEELFRKFVPSNGCFRAINDKEPSADAFLHMTLPHMYPPHDVLADHLASITYSAGTLPPDFQGMAPTDLTSLFCTDEVLATHLAERNELVDPVAHTSIPFVPSKVDCALSAEDDTLQKIYPHLKTIQDKYILETIAIRAKRDDPLFDAESELDRLSQTAINTLTMLSQERITGIPTQFYRISSEWQSRLKPSMMRAKVSRPRCYNLWTMKPILDNPQSKNYDEGTLILGHLIDMAASKDGYDLMPFQIGPFCLIINGNHNLPIVKFGAQPGIIIVGNAQVGKSKILEMAMAATPNSMVHETSGSSDKAWTAQTETVPAMHCEDEAVCPDKGNDAFSKRNNTRMSTGKTTYDRFNLNGGRAAKRARNGAPPAHVTVIETQDCRRLEIKCTNDPPSLLLSWASRYLIFRAYALSKTDLKDTRSKSERVSSTKSSGASDVSLVLQLWVSYSWMPHHIAAVIGMKIGEHIKEVFFSMYNRFMGELHGYPTLPPRTVDCFSSFAAGSMVSRLTTKMFRWRTGTTPMELLSEMRRGGYALQMSDLVNNWILASGSTNRMTMIRKALCVIKSLVSFEKGIEDAPEMDDTQQYYILSCEFKKLPSVMDTYSDLGYGLIANAIHELQNSTHATSNLPVLCEIPSTGQTKVLQASVDVPHIAAFCEHSLRDCLNKIIEFDTEYEYHAINYAETGRMFKRSIMYAFMEGHQVPLQMDPKELQKLEGKMLQYKQAIYFWGKSGLLSYCKDREATPDYPVAISFPETDDLVTEPCVEGGRFDFRPTGGELRRKRKVPYYGAHIEVFDKAFSDSGDESGDDVILREFLDYCYCSADPSNVGKLVFLAMSQQHTDTHAPARFHKVRAITEPLIVRNPSRVAQSLFIEAEEPTSLFGGSNEVDIGMESYFDRRARQAHADEYSI